MDTNAGTGGIRRSMGSAAELFDLKGRVALVTGASSGLGVRFAEVLAREGAAVALVARRKEKLAAVQARIEQAGGRAVAIAADVLDRAAMTRAFDEAETAFGTVTILVNNAGVAPPEITTRHIYVGIIPFVLIQLFALVVLWFVPGLATALPRMLYGG